MAWERVSVQFVHYGCIISIIQHTIVLNVRKGVTTPLLVQRELAQNFACQHIGTMHYTIMLIVQNSFSAFR